MANESIVLSSSNTNNNSSQHIKEEDIIASDSPQQKPRSLSAVTPSPKKKMGSSSVSPTRSLSPSALENSFFSKSSSLNNDTDDDTDVSSYEDYDDYLEDEEDSLLLIDPAGQNFNYHIVDDTTSNTMDEKQLFFPPNYHNDPPLTHHPHHPKQQQNSSSNTTTNNNNNNISFETKASIPSYFLCPITHQIMIDPVIDLEGNTYERHAIIRWLVLYENISPITGNTLKMEELKVDKLVKVAIEKARRDAWMKYILELGADDDCGGGSGSNDDEKKKKKGEGTTTKVLKQRTSSEPKPKQTETTDNNNNNDNNTVVMSELESYLDRKNNVTTGSSGASRSGSKHSVTTSGSKHSGSSSSQGKKKKKEVISAAGTGASGSSSTGGSLPPTSSSKKQEEPQQQQQLRPKTPPLGKIPLSKEKRNASVKSNKSSKSNSTSGSKQPQSSQAARRLSSETPPPPSTNPISSITVPTKLPTTMTSQPPPLISSNTSITSAISFGMDKLHNGWTVPLGVHKIICSSPGLLVSTTVHRRSTPVKRTVRDINNNFVKQDLIIAPGSYVEILETQVHGGRVRGRIVWEEEDVEGVDMNNRRRKKKKKGNSKKKKSLLEKRPKRKSKMFQRGRAKKKEDDGTHEDEDDESVWENMVKYSGWISVQWADEDDEEGNAAAAKLGSGSDEDAGPWTEPIPLGVYRISFGAGLPLRETPERDSAVVDKLERGRCVEVVETTVKGDRVRARCLVPPLPQEGDDQKKPARFQSGWISLLNALTGASGASPVPLGAYVAVAEGGCIITEGGRLDSKEKGTLNPGSCIEVVATRIEEGTVRGLIAAGGHVTLFVLNGASSNQLAAVGGTKNPDGGRMFAMPVPLGTYQVVQNGLSVTTGLSMNSAVSMKLKVNACAEIAETRVEGGRVRGRLTAVGYGGVAKEVNGWMSLFEPTQRWAKIVCFKGGKPISPIQQQEQAQA